MKKQILILVLSIVCSLTGCQKYPAFSGKVTYSDDHSPVTNGTVCFEAKGFFGRGQLQADGTYNLGSVKPGDGLPYGSYKVYITGAENITQLERKAGNAKSISTGYVIPKNMPPGAKIIANQMIVPLIEDSFTSVKRTPLSVTVDKNTRTFDFQVDRYKAK